MKQKSKKSAKKDKRMYRRITFWLGVLVLGTVIGFAVQFTRAWVEPEASPPGGNIAAPINTGASKQVKVGNASTKADICVDPYGNGDEKCLSDLVSFPACTLAGGIPTMVDGITLCKFPGASCPSGWAMPPGTFYTETVAATCTGGGNCGTSVTSGSHSFANIDPASEAATYYDCTSSYNSCCYTTYDCPPGPWICGSPCPCCFCGASPTCHGCSSETSTPRTCMPLINFVGCVQE